MCGIFVVARLLDSSSSEPGDSEAFDELCSELRKANANRGPDAQNSFTLTSAQLRSPKAFDCSSNDSQPSPTLIVDLYASELRLRGEGPVVQPHVRGKNVLCWNGEIFEGIEVSAQENDGEKLFNILCDAKTPEDIRDVFASIEGPYAFAFYHELSGRLYFGRDPLGRRSLLIHRPTQAAPYFILSSVSAGAHLASDFAELSTEHLFSLKTRSLETHGDMPTAFQDSLDAIARSCAMKESFYSFAEPAKVNTLIPGEDPPRLQSLDEIPQFLKQTVDEFISHLDRSVRLRVQNIPDYSPVGTKPRVGVLFSGGIDSTMLAFLAHRHVPSEEGIDLLNVAFENPRKMRVQKEGNIGGISRKHGKPAKLRETSKSNATVSYSVPDRITGLQEVEELRRLCPERTWNFVEINVPYDESQAARPMVESLMHPGRTVMDLSLALALYFASRGKGQRRRYPDSPPEPYHSEARVLLNGLGSDELLGGYGRHRSVYNSAGWHGIIAELQQEIDRIPTRNLGRDDRVISSHGKETRHPFLSLDLVSFLASLPVNYKLDPRLELGLGDKMLLRLAARKLGLVEASCRKKRAMQFGSHSARMDGERRGDVELE